MRKHWPIIVVTFVSVVTLVSVLVFQMFRDDQARIRTVSVADLVKDPLRYDNQEIRVTGWLNETTSSNSDIAVSDGISTTVELPFVGEREVEVFPADVEKGSSFELYNIPPEKTGPMEAVVSHDAWVNADFLKEGARQEMVRDLHGTLVKYTTADWPFRAWEDHRIFVDVAPTPLGFYGYLGKKTLVGRWRVKVYQNGQQISYLRIDTREQSFPP